MTRTHPRLAFAGVLTLVALTGCSGGGGSGSAAGGSANADRMSVPAAGAVNSAHAAAQPARVADTSSTVQQKAVIKEGTVAIHTTDPQHARDRVDHLLRRLHGSIDDEQTVYDKQGRIRDSRLVLRVPVASFATAMKHVEHLGTVVHSSSNAKDVTTEVIDVRQRLTSLRISLHDLNGFQRSATDIGQLLRFENAITQRRGQYQSLKAQRNHLLNETSMSTIDLDISLPPATHPTVAKPRHHAGFGTGLRHGWSAFTGAVTVVLTALGAALPFAVLLAVVGLPLWWWTRRTSRSRPAAATPEGPTD